MDEKTYQAIISGEQKYLDISDLSETGQAFVRLFYEFLNEKQQKEQKK